MKFVGDKAKAFTFCEADAAAAVAPSIAVDIEDDETSDDGGSDDRDVPSPRPSSAVRDSRKKVDTPKRKKLRRNLTAGLDKLLDCLLSISDNPIWKEQASRRKFKQCDRVAVTVAWLERICESQDNITAFRDLVGIIPGGRSQAPALLMPEDMARKVRQRQAAVAKAAAPLDLQIPPTPPASSPLGSKGNAPFYSSVFGVGALAGLGMGAAFGAPGAAEPAVVNMDSIVSDLLASTGARAGGQHRDGGNGAQPLTVDLSFMATGSRADGSEADNGREKGSPATPMSGVSPTVTKAGMALAALANGLCNDPLGVVEATMSGARKLVSAYDGAPIMTMPSCVGDGDGDAGDAPTVPDVFAVPARPDNATDQMVASYPDVLGDFLC